MKRTHQIAIRRRAKEELAELRKLAPLAVNSPLRHNIQKLIDSVLEYLHPAHHDREFTGAIRLTHHYDDGYADMDDWNPLGVFRILSSRITSEGFDSAASVIRVRAPMIAARYAITRALNDQYSTGCSCEHDCCGHWQTRVNRVTHDKRREYLVEVRHYRNV